MVIYNSPLLHIASETDIDLSGINPHFGGQSISKNPAQVAKESQIIVKCVLYIRYVYGLLVLELEHSLKLVRVWKGSY